MSTEKKEASIDELLRAFESLSEEVRGLRSELTETKLRAENAELRLQLSEQKKSEVDKPLLKGQNRTNDWLEEIVSYPVPFDHLTKEPYTDVVVNGVMFRMMAGKTVKMPRYVALVLEEKERNTMKALMNAMALQNEFRNAEASNFITLK